ncbi:CYFIP-related Rac1 interactor A [Zophobas morio]|uniref:CYFIP-related Rac1 interactor A n=1 Tax=Zophobas morio TaxID=2755281 RepID=UPI0030833DEA
MSLFFASSFPALLVIIEMTSDYLKKEENKTDLILNLILALASVCKDTLDTPNCLEKLKSSNKDELILRAMVESTVVYDHLSPAGAFCKKSAFPMRPVIQTVKNFSQESVSKELLGVLQHRSKHFNDPDTPRHLQLLIK